MAHNDDCKIGKLASNDYPYFEARGRRELETEGRVRNDLQSCLTSQALMPVSGIIGPNIVIRRSFNSIEAVISKNILRNAAGIWRQVGDKRPLFATIAMDAEALQDRDELDEFLTDVTLLDDPPQGFYLLVNNVTSEIQPELVDHRTLAGWMFLNHSLALNGFEVINGFSDILTPFLVAAGGTGGATGWWNNLKVFSLDRFQANVGGGRRPVFRYMSKRLLNSIRFDELERLRHQFPEVLNGLESDSLYSDDDGSRPEGQEQEVLQTWHALSSYAGSDGKIDISSCRTWLREAIESYGKINASPGLRLVARSNAAHLIALQDGIQLFSKLAEIDLHGDS